MKNLEAALQLLAREPHWRLAFAGQGPDLVRLQRIAAEIGCSERVHWLGELSPDDVAHFLRALDVFVFPSLSESFGLAAAEAALAGVPVVANDLPALREVLASGGAPCAVLTCARDPGQFHAAVAGLLQDETRMASLAARGRELGMRYSVGSMVNAYERLLNDLASERAK
jgi:glycosyltransferase involved in cell wall biosynthesis